MIYKRVYVFDVPRSLADDCCLRRRRGGDFDHGTGGSGRFPVGGQEDAKVVLVGHGRESLKDVGDKRLSA